MCLPVYFWFFSLQFLWQPIIWGHLNSSVYLPFTAACKLESTCDSSFLRFTLLERLYPTLFVSSPGQLCPVNSQEAKAGTNRAYRNCLRHAEWIYDDSIYCVLKMILNQHNRKLIFCSSPTLLQLLPHCSNMLLEYVATSSAALDCLPALHTWI